MFSVQLIWSLWFIGFVLLAQIVMVIISINTGNNIGDFILFSHGSAKIYMLVIGIISSYGFLTFYVNHGITRKDYFIGTAIAALGIAIALAVIATVITALEYGLIEWFNIPVSVDKTVTENVINSSDNSITIMLPKAIVSSSILVHSSSWIVSLLMYILNTLTYYVIGWFIGVGYYKYGWVIGFGFIASSLVFLITGDLLWGTELGEPLSNWFAFQSVNLPLWGSFVGSIILIALILVLIRALTREISIKM